MPLTDEQLEHFRKLLMDERERLERELDTVGERNPEDPEDWQLKPDALDVMEADRNEVADRAEDLVDNASILNSLEVQYNRVKRALAKISAGTYGRCEVCGEPIPLDRLEVNPSALTTVEHETKLHS